MRYTQSRFKAGAALGAVVASGVLAAYDVVLVLACRALDVPDTLSGVPEGLEREVARLEVEERLVSVGLIPGRTPGR